MHRNTKGRTFQTPLVPERASCPITVGYETNGKQSIAIKYENIKSPPNHGSVATDEPSQVPINIVTQLLSQISYFEEVARKKGSTNNTVVRPSEKGRQ